MPSRVDFGTPTIVVRGAGVAVRWRLRSVLVGTAIALLALAVATWALTFGPYVLSLDQVWGAIINRPDAGFARTVVVQWRMPRVIAALVFGAALGVSGAVFQSLTRNPLASPDVIGFATGSYTGALVVIILIGGTYLQIAAGAIAGGLITATLVYLLSWQRGVKTFRLIVIGIAVSATLASFNTWLMLTADLDIAMTAAAWGAGSLNGVNWEQALGGSAFIALILIALVALAPAIHQLGLGDEAAKATGAPTERTRIAAFALGVALTSVVTAAAGPVAFIALAAPQIARRLTRSPGMSLTPAAFTGALLFVAADAAAQNIFPVTLPVGVVTVVIGGSYLVWLISYEMRRR